MRNLATQKQALAYLQDRRAPAAVVKAFGDLIEDAEAVWQTDPRGLFEGAAGQLSTTVVTPPQFTNYNTSFIAPFVTGRTSVIVLPSNQRRTMLLIQNLSAASNLYFNFSGGASPNNGVLLSFGEGIIFDSICPSDSVNCYYDNATPQLGIVLEVRFTTY